MFRDYFGDPALEITDVAPLEAGSNESMIGALTGGRRGRERTLGPSRITLQTSGAERSLDVFVKTKPHDGDVLDAGEALAASCDEGVAAVIGAFRSDLPVAGSHRREPGFYASANDRMRRYLPICYGAWSDDGNEEWGMVLEYVSDAALIDATDAEQWTPAHIDAAVTGLADMHSVWFGREAALLAEPWLGRVSTSASVVAMTPLWRALAAHAAPTFREWAGADLVAVHQQLAADVAAWWPALEQGPRTLIHHDFNPRNCAIRAESAGLRLCAYDWELATLGAPERDLAEFLCFVLPSSVDSATLNHWIERYARSLEAAVGRPVERDTERRRFAAALGDVLVDRLSFYTLIHRIRPQAFLPRIVRTWFRLFQLTREALD